MEQVIAFGVLTLVVVIALGVFAWVESLDRPSYRKRR